MTADFSPDRERQRDLAVLRYVRAVDRGDLDEIIAVLAEAEADAELDRRLAGVNAALHAEAGLPPVEEQARTIRQLLLRHLPSAFPEEVGPTPLTVGDIAARLQADHAAGRRLADADYAANRALLSVTVPLPPSITAAAVRDLAAGLPATASARYWELFRRAAVMLAVARQQGQVQLAAARRQAGHRPPAARPRPSGMPEEERA